MRDLRLRVDDMEATNAYLPEFVADHNRRFAVAPREAEDTHRPVLHDARRAGADRLGATRRSVFEFEWDGEGGKQTCGSTACP